MGNISIENSLFIYLSHMDSCCHWFRIGGLDSYLFAQFVKYEVLNLL